MNPLIFPYRLVWGRVSQFLRYYLRAQTIFQIHSPSVYRIADLILSQKESISSLENLYQKWKYDSTIIKRTEHGAGSSLKLQNTIRDVMKYSVSSRSQCRGWYHLARFLKPKYVLEMGTSLGLSSLFLQAGAKEATVITMEGDQHIAKLAKVIFEESQIRPFPRLIQGLFDDEIQAVLTEFPILDLVFIDGNHTYEATMRYWRLMQANLTNNSVVIIHDIYWSEEMALAWNKIKKENRVTVSLDFFHFGILLLSNNFAEKQDFSLIAAQWKPFALGIFA